MEEVHKLNRPPFLQCPVVNSLWFIVKLYLHWEDLNMLYEIA